jgi:hypothetical protein
VGTLEAVAPLMPLRDKMFGDARVRALARETINSIQGRAPRGAQGQLSLIQQDHQVGRVSLADPEPQPSASQPMDSDEM